MKRNLDIWLPAFLNQVYGKLFEKKTDKPLTLILAVADHFEPFWGKASSKVAFDRVDQWKKRLPYVGQDIKDSKGRNPQHTFFYPLDEYEPTILDHLAELCQKGLGDVEVHLHHQGETSAQLEDYLLTNVEKLYQRHGLLRKDPQTGQITYGFIHGNWALDNSRPDGLWCGVNDEISILARTGCYADFTLPSAPSPTQTRTVNSIYYATDDPLRPKSHDVGCPVEVGVPPNGDLLMVQGVLGLNWRKRKHFILPSIEDSDLSAYHPPSLDRLPVWLKYAPTVKGAEHIKFLKLHCHGAPETHQEFLLGKPLRKLWEHLNKLKQDKNGFRLLFVTCWEMVHIIHALEKGEEPF